MAAPNEDATVTFSQAPLAEVVCGVQFQPLPLQTAHFGAFWERVRSSYSKTLDQPPLAPVIEATGDAPGFGLISWSTLPDLRRVFLIDEARGRLLQLQPTRFHHNWQRRPDGNVYPRFPALRTEFFEQWKAFVDFLRDNALPAPQITQNELTYINHILTDASGGGLELRALFPWLDARNVALSSPSPEIELGLHYDLPECRGRLHVAIRTATRVQDQARVVVLELTARGAPPSERGDESLADWLSTARDAIVQSFVQLTGPEAHAHWNRAQ